MAVSTCVWDSTSKLYALDGSVLSSTQGTITIKNPTTATATASLVYSNFPAIQEIYKTMNLYVVINWDATTNLNGAGANPMIVEVSGDQGTTWSEVVHIARGTAAAASQFEFSADLLALFAITNPAMVWVRLTLNCNATDTINNATATFRVFDIAIEATV